MSLDLRLRSLRAHRWEFGVGDEEELGFRMTKSITQARTVTRAWNDALPVDPCMARTVT